MKMKIFYDKVEKVQDSFNKWAKGKHLNKDVLIMAVPYPGEPGYSSDYLAIVVVHPEGKEWDETEVT